MHNQQLDHHGVGSLRLCFGLLLLLVICQQCWTAGYEDDICVEVIEKRNCPYGNYTIMENGCPRLYCYRTLDEECNNEDRKCSEPLVCNKCGLCMGCIRKFGTLYNCNNYVCPDAAKQAKKRLPSRVPAWFRRPRWQKFSQKYFEPEYND
ncbi:hypothetical protein KR222_000762 [Zaprionus bogoriensis]|nr:hypothetical protein KR222_000762 [Zaprionus bogoriensis]